MFKKLQSFMLILLLTITSNTFACNKSTKSKKCESKTYSAERYSAARTFARMSMRLQVLKESRCTNKENITVHTEADLSLIKKTLSQSGKFRFSLDLIKLKRHLNNDINQKIDKSKKITGNIDKICRSLESEYKGRYKKTKQDYFKIIGHKIVLQK